MITFKELSELEFRYQTEYSRLTEMRQQIETQNALVLRLEHDLANAPFPGAEKIDTQMMPHVDIVITIVNAYRSGLGS